MKLRFSPLCLIAIVGALSCSVPARAGLIVGNLDQTPGALSPSNISSTESWAQQFMTDSHPYYLTSIRASLGNYDPGTDFQLTATLLADSGGSPGTTVLSTLSFDVSTIPTSGFANVVFAPPNTVSLSADTSYWFALSGSSTDGRGGTDWQFTDSTTVSGPGTLPNYAFGPSPGTWDVFGGTPFLIEVNGPVIPEPSSILLSSIGIGGLALGFRWAKRRKDV